MLTFEINADGNMLEIHCDDDGIATLRRALSKLEKKPVEHEHLMSPSWAGNELTERIQGSGNSLLHQVTFYRHPTL